MSLLQNIYLSSLRPLNQLQLSSDVRVLIQKIQNIQLKKKLQLQKLMHQKQRLTTESSVLASKFKLLKKIGSGSFGEIYLCQHIQKKQMYAAKIEKKDKGQGQLQYEIKLYQTFAGIQGIARMLDFGFEGSQYFLIMELLGESLEDLMDKQGRKFTIATVFKIGLQIIDRLEAIHKKGFIHRDIKANNFMVGKNEKRDTVFIIDFGLAKRYMDTKTGQHIPFKEGKSLVGTARYASIASHQGKEQGRKDDLESLGFLLLYFARGKLPWQGIQIKNKTQKYAEIGRIKKQTTIQKLAGPLGKSSETAFVAFFSYVRSLKFPDQPDYEKIRNFFKDELIKSNQVNEKFDWMKTRKQDSTGNIETNFQIKMDVQ